MTKTKLLLLAAAAAFGSTSALAQKAGDWQVGAGWLGFFPQDSSEPLTFTAPRPAVVPGSGASVSNASTLGLNLTYFINSNWAVEGVIGVPPKFKLDGTGTLGPIGELGEARQWSPTILAKYYFLDGEARLRPYVGLGATYVWYNNVDLTPGLQGALASRIGVPPALSATSGKIDSSFAAVFNLGASYQIDPHWGIAFSVSYIPLKTTAKLTTTVAGVPVAASQSSLKLDPIVPYLALTYRF
jgi:outer membrane protein